METPGQKPEITQVPGNPEINPGIPENPKTPANPEISPMREPMPEIPKEIPTHGPDAVPQRQTI